MTIIGIGNALPLQLELMKLGGVVVKNKSIVTTPNKFEIENSQQEALLRLKHKTGMDYGNNVLLWFQYLSKHFNSEITHSYGYRAMHTILYKLGVKLPILGPSYNLEPSEINERLPKYQIWVNHYLGKDSSLDGLIFSFDSSIISVDLDRLECSNSSLFAYYDDLFIDYLSDECDQEVNLIKEKLKVIREMIVE